MASSLKPPEQSFVVAQAVTWRTRKMPFSACPERPRRRAYSALATAKRREDGSLPVLSEVEGR